MRAQPCVHAKNHGWCFTLGLAGLHHSHQLRKVDDSIAISMHLHHEICNCLCPHCSLKRVVTENLIESSRDFAVAVLLKTPARRTSKGPLARTTCACPVLRPGTLCSLSHYLLLRVLREQSVAFVSCHVLPTNFGSLVTFRRFSSLS